MVACTVDGHPPHPRGLILVFGYSGPVEAEPGKGLLDRFFCQVDVSGDQSQRPAQTLIFLAEQGLRRVVAQKCGGGRTSTLPGIVGYHAQILRELVHVVDRTAPPLSTKPILRTLGRAGNRALPPIHDRATREVDTRLPAAESEGERGSRADRIRDCRTSSS